MLVNAVWIGKEFPLLQRMCAQSWLDWGHEYHLWVYDHVDNVPPDVIVRDAVSVLPGPIHTYQDQRHKDSPVLHANLFRYKFLFDRGGAFVDADTLCLSQHEIGGLAFSSEGKNQHPNLAFVCAPKERTVMALCLSHAYKALEDPVWGNFGPKLLKKCIAATGDKSKVLPPEAFCPLNWNETERFFEANNAIKFTGSYGIHLWQQVLEKRGQDLNGNYPETSLWEQWKARHGQSY